MILAPDKIRKLFPKCSVPLAEALSQAMQNARIETPARIAAFLAQVGHESGGMSRMIENLNYSAAGLIAIWPVRFKSKSLAEQLARKPELIANHVYANRMGNGSPESGDGWKYRGRGLIQVTGKDNYREAGKDLGLPLLADPDLLLQPVNSARSACWFWTSRGLNELADADMFAQITRRINGGLHGQDERVALRERIIAELRG